MLEHEELSGRIIGAAMEVHRKLGPGFVESLYEVAFAIELRRRQMRFVRQLLVPVYYDEVEIGTHRLDLLVEDEFVVELKAIKTIEDIHCIVVKSYLRASGKHHGLILNFAGPKLGIKRVLLTAPP